MSCVPRSILILVMAGMLLNSSCTTMKPRWFGRQKSGEQSDADPFTGSERVRVAVTLIDGEHHAYAESLRSRLSSALECSGRCIIVSESVSHHVDQLSMIVPPISNMRGSTDYIITIQVHEFTPYRPMRLRANFQLIDPISGVELATICNTWESMGDLAPVGASRATGRLLRFPVVPLVEERESLARTSPQAFLDNVSREVAQSLANTIPRPSEWIPPPINEESVTVPEASHWPQ